MKDEIKKTNGEASGQKLSKVEALETFSKEQVQKKAEASFRKGRESINSEIEKQNAELKELRYFKEKIKGNEQTDELISKLKSDEIQKLGLQGFKYFVNEFKDRLLKKDNVELLKEIKKIKAEKNTSIFFKTSKVSASSSIINNQTIGKDKAQPEKVEYWSGSSIRKRK